MIARLGFAALICFALLSGLGTAGAADAANGTYKGKVAGAGGLKVEVKRNRITKYRGSIYASCFTGNFRIGFSYPPPARKHASIKIKRSGYFKTVFKSNPRVSINDDRRTIRGRFKGGKVSGSMKVEGLCSAKTTFSAGR